MGPDPLRPSDHPAGPHPRPGPGRVLPGAPPSRRPIDRSWERRIVVAGILLASVYLIAALATGTLPAAERRGIWLPLHLALAGAASTLAVAGPLVAGWLGITFLGSATHLLPAVGPGTPQVHAAQRRHLGRAASARLVVLDAGCLALSVGLLFAVDDLARLGLALLLAGMLATAALLLGAVRLGLGARR
jgi:hypothetical protein